MASRFFIASVALVTACATLNVQTTRPRVSRLTTEVGGTCSAWPARTGKWVTAGHCTVDPLFWDDGSPAPVLLIDSAIDLAIVAGPNVMPFPIASHSPVMGDTVRVFGYAMGRTLVMFPGVYVDTVSFFREQDDFLVGLANGIPGMSGGPIFSGDRVVSVMIGGGTPTSYVNNIGFGVPTHALRNFLDRYDKERQ